MTAGRRGLLPFAIREELKAPIQHRANNRFISGQKSVSGISNTGGSRLDAQQAGII